MANEVTTRWGFATRQTDVATNTTLGTATRFEFGAKTITVNASSVTVRSAFLKIKAIDSEPTTAVDWDGVRIGSNVAASGWVDVDTTLTQANSGENECMEWLADITSDVVASVSGTVTTFTLDVAVAVATGVASNVRSITCELFLTYTRDAASTNLKTVIFPLMSNDRLPSTAYLEVGTTAFITNDGLAPPNQIPQLTGAGDPELSDIGSGSIKDQYIILTGVNNHAGVTDYNLTMRLDGATDITLSTYEAGLNTDMPFSEIIPAANMPSTSATHAFEVKTSLNSTGRWVGGLMVVTYEYDTTASKQLNSCIVPFGGDVHYQSFVVEPTQRWVAKLHIQEPGPIIPRQSGAVVNVVPQAGSQNYLLNFEGQRQRTYDNDTGYVYTSTCEIVHRADVSQSAFDLCRGWNEFKLDFEYTSLASHHATGYMIVNYHSGKSAHGADAHNHTIWMFHRAYSGTPFATGESYTPAAPTITGDYKLSGVFLEGAMRANSPRGQFTMALNGDDDGGSGVYRGRVYDATGLSELGSKRVVVDMTDWFRGESVGSYSGGVWSGGSSEAQAYGADVEAAHLFASGSYATNVSFSTQSVMAVTYHQIYANVNGAYTVDGSPETNFRWDLYAVDEVEETSVLVTRGQVPADSEGPGASEFNACVFDDTLLYQVVIHDATNNWSVASAAGYAAMYSGNNDDRLDTPSIRSVGVPINVGAAGGTPTLGKHRKYDYSVLAIHTNGNEDITLSDAQGFTEIASSPQTQGTANRVKVFVKQHTGKNETPPTLSASATWMVAGIITIRGAHRTAPLDDTDGSTAGSSTTANMPDTTPTVANDLILHHFNDAFDGLAMQVTPTGGRGWTNSNLKNLREVWGQGTTASDGGSGYIIAGKALASGAIGTTTATLANAATQAAISMAIKPHVPSAGDFNVAAFTGGAVTGSKVPGVGATYVR